MRAGVTDLWISNGGPVWWVEIKIESGMSEAQEEFKAWCDQFPEAHKYRIVKSLRDMQSVLDEID